MAKSQPEKYVPVSKTVFDAFLNDLDLHKGRKDKAATAIAQAYKSHQNTYGMHTKAAKHAITLKNMEPEDRADYLRAFDEYRKTLGLDEQLDIFDSASNDDTKDGEAA